MEEYIVNLIGSFGYFGMFIAMVLEAVIIIIPSELILATGGILASSGKFSLLGAFIIGLIGSVFCAIVIYVMGYYGGRKFIIKYGKFFFMKQKTKKAVMLSHHSLRFSCSESLCNCGQATETRSASMFQEQHQRR